MNLSKKLFTVRNVVLSVVLLVMLVLVLMIPSVASHYILRATNFAMITVLCVLSVYVLLGMCGQNSFAQAGFLGCGAYICANMTVRLGLAPILGMAIAIAGTALVAFLLGFAFFRLRQFYFTFSTIGLMVIFNELFKNWTPVTGGSMGFEGIRSFSIFGIEFATERMNFYLIFAFCVLSYFLVKFLTRTALGRSFMAIRDNEIAANCMGINSLLTKSISFSIAGALCGLAGSLYAFLFGYLSYTSFTYEQSTRYLVMIMLGGTASPVGAVIGGVSLTLLQEMVRSLQNYMLLIFGVGIMILMIFQPEGLLGGGRALYGKLSQRLGRNKAAGADAE
ncbi:MAG: branched-chain amino acid ABC transporter permease [Christensenellales bacterium]|jgi:branched-chain amino acid transport system permease protein